MVRMKSLLLPFPLSSQKKSEEKGPRWNFFFTLRLNQRRLNLKIANSFSYFCLRRSTSRAMQSSSSVEITKTLTLESGVEISPR